MRNAEPDPEREQAEAHAVELAAFAWGHVASEDLRRRLATLSDDELRRELGSLKWAVRQDRHPRPKSQEDTLAIVRERSGLDTSIPIDDLEEWLDAQFSIRVATDGLLECDRLTERLGWVGDLPFALYHHTSTALLDAIRADGLKIGKQTNFFNSQAGVYVSTIAAGTPVSVYAARAARVHGGEPTTLRVARRLRDLTPDPDDSDLAWAQGRQFITPHVPPEDIRWDAAEEQPEQEAAADRVQRPSSAG